MFQTRRMPSLCANFRGPVDHSCQILTLFFSHGPGYGLYFKFCNGALRVLSVWAALSNSSVSLYSSCSCHSILFKCWSLTPSGFWLRFTDNPLVKGGLGFEILLIKSFRGPAGRWKSQVTKEIDWGLWVRKLLTFLAARLSVWMSCFPGKKIIGAQSYMEMKRSENKNKAIKKKHDP